MEKLCAWLIRCIINLIGVSTVDNWKVSTLSTYTFGFSELKNVPITIKSHHLVRIDRSPTVIISRFAFGYGRKDDHRRTVFLICFVEGMVCRTVLFLNNQEMFQPFNYVS